MDECPPWKRVQIGKQSMERWNLAMAIEHTKENFLKVKEKFKGDVTFHEKATNAVQKYLESVEWTAQRLTEDWEKPDKMNPRE